MLALHVDKLLHGEALVVRQVDEEGLGDDLQVLFDPVLKFQEVTIDLYIKECQVGKSTLSTLYGLGRLCEQTDASFRFYMGSVVVCLGVVGAHFARFETTS